MAQHAEVFSWFTHPVYNRYWQHYRMAMSWQERHKQAYRRALAAYAFPPSPWPNPAAGPPRYADWHAGEHAAAGERSETDERDSGSDSEIECDVSNMEITDELRQYFAQTEKHREELSEYAWAGWTWRCRRFTCGSQSSPVPSAIPLCSDCSAALSHL
ncbi:hypothetical protein COCON_G00199000 [Conger conger]|uniref:Gem-associated protein 8 n=1 Tax=Conger conger TaxID=82655 RepID=A0A9Q1HPI1_CONCO|nr:hypothetical protein COCON_G00199000 [Conger conger]